MYYCITLILNNMEECGELRAREQRIVYLLTYSRADLEKFPAREDFARAVTEAWLKTTGAKVCQWVVAREMHANTDSTACNLFHYHMALKLEKRARWLSVRNCLDDENGIKVNFSAHHNTYYSAYKYTTKEDPNFVLSEGHPDLDSVQPPRTERAITGKRRKGKEWKKSSGKGRKRGLSVFEVAEYIQNKKIKTRLELMSIAASQKREGKCELAEFICNRGGKVVDECLSIAHELGTAEEKLQRANKSRLDILLEVRESICAPDCNGKWLEAACNLLQRNEIPVSSFAQAIYVLLEQGRGKYRNVYIYGPANCGKTFMLSPLKIIYHTFCNPATGTFAWVGAEEAEIIMLNDFRWKPSIIAWGDLLQLLEGDITHLPAPKNFSKRDIELSKDTPVFATADAPIVLVKGGVLDQANTEMCNVRWNFIHFWRQIPPTQQLQLQPCAHCFAQLVLDNLE